VVDLRFWRSERLGSKAATDGLVGATWEATAGQPSVGAVLTAFSGGPAATVCRRRWSQDRGKAYREDLEALYPHYAKHSMAARFLDWPGDPLDASGLLVSGPRTGDNHCPLLHSGLGRLHFAGEHACYKFVGYMEGALSSGVAVARRLVAREGTPSAAPKAPRPFELEAGNPVSSQEAGSYNL